MITKEASEGVALGAGRFTLGTVWEFLWRGQALRAASACPTLSAVCRERLRRARLAAELGDRSIDAAEPLRAGPSLPLAMSLYREAAYWALAGRQDGSDLVGLAEVWAASESHLSRTGLTSAELAVVHNALVDKTFVDTAGDSVEVMGREVAFCQRF